MFWAETGTLVSSDLDLDWLALAKISMLRLNIGSGMLSSCMLSIGLGPKYEQGKGGGLPPPLALFAFGYEANAEHA